VYERLTLREQKIADTETAKFIEEGKEIFHSSDKLGGTIGVSCDMCHPDAANTDPETYPKYQTQLQRVALLRDMINWCIENPVKGQPLSPDDPRLRALEAISFRSATAPRWLTESTEWNGPMVPGIRGRLPGVPVYGSRSRLKREPDRCESRSFLPRADLRRWPAGGQRLLWAALRRSQVF
jgi:hypothetical protein